MTETYPSFPRILVAPGERPDDIQEESSVMATTSTNTELQNSTDGMTSNPNEIKTKKQKADC